MHFSHEAFHNPIIVNLIMKMRLHPSAYPQSFNSLFLASTFTGNDLNFALGFFFFAVMGVYITEGVRIRVRVQVTAP